MLFKYSGLGKEGRGDAAGFVYTSPAGYRNSALAWRVFR